MLQTFKARLKAKYSGVNLSNERITAIADRLHKKFPELTEDADHDAKLDELNDLAPFDESAKQDDKLRTLEAKTRGQKTPEEIAAEVEAARKAAEGNDGMPEWFKTYQKSVDDKLDGILKEKSVNSIRQQATEKLKDVPAKFWNKRALPEKDEDIETFITEVQNDYKEFHQGLVNEGLAGTSIPKGSSAPTGKASKEEVDKIVDSIT